MRYSKDFTDWCMHDDERYMLTSLEAVGTTIEEMMESAVISIEDWHGNCARIDWSLGDLDIFDFTRIEQLLIDFLAK